MEDKDSIINNSSEFTKDEIDKKIKFLYNNIDELESLININKLKYEDCLRFLETYYIKDDSNNSNLKLVRNIEISDINIYQRISAMLNKIYKHIAVYLTIVQDKTFDSKQLETVMKNCRELISEVNLRINSEINKESENAKIKKLFYPDKK